VGYAGGIKENPSYYNLGGHSETIQIDYDPNQITYEELLNVFWNSHNPTHQPWSRQYMSFIFYHNDEQKKLALETRQREEDSRGKPIVTEVVPASEFYLAEGYHQKYYLQQSSQFAHEYRSIYPSTEEFVASTAVARVNGYLGGYGSSATFEEESASLGLSPAATDRLREIIAGLED
jgi:peptide-methionine (S)-S-oxide reductase